MTRDHIRTAAAIAAGLTIGIIPTAALRHVSAQSGAQRRVIRPQQAPDTGLPFSPGIFAGNTLDVAGHLGRDPVTSRLVTGGIEPETRQALANIREVLKTAEMDFKDVASVTVYIVRIRGFAKFNAIYRQTFPREPSRPAT